MDISLNLLKGEWFTSKMSGLEIGIFMLDKDIRKENKQKLINQIIMISKDPVYPVRKAVANSIPQLVDLIPTFPIVSVHEIIKELMRDVADVVRNEIIDGAILFAEKIKDTHKDLLQDLGEVFYQGYSDSSWRVRKLYIEKTQKIFEIFEGISIPINEVSYSES